MTTYTAIANTEVDAESPVTEELVTRLRDNPLAIAEGDSSAPKVQGIALDNVYKGSVFTIGNAATNFTGLAGAQWIRIDFSVFSSGPSVSFQIGYSNDNGSSFGSYQTITSTAADRSGVIYINLSSGAISGYSFALVNLTQTHTVPSGCNAIRLRVDDVAGNYGAHVCIVEA